MSNGNGNGHQWSKFFWRDWSADKALHPCSLAAKGFWIEMLCIMHEGTPVGHLTMGGKPASNRQMAANAYCSEREAAKYLAELETAGVFSRTEDGTIYCRRMEKDGITSSAGREYAEKRWKDHKPNGSPNGSPNGRANGGASGAPTGNPNAKNLESRKEKEESLSSLTSFKEERPRAYAPAREEEPSVAAVRSARRQSAAEIASMPAPVAAAIGQIAAGLKATQIPRGPDRWAQLDALAEGQRTRVQPQDPIRTPAEQYAAIVGISVAEAEAKLSQSEVA